MKVYGIKCNKCGDIIYSRAVHDFHWCKCNAVAVDGGLSYLRIVGNKEDWTRVEIELPIDGMKGRGILYDDWNHSKNKYGHATEKDKVKELTTNE